MMRDQIRAYYDANVEQEWGRLERNRMEFAITTRCLSQHLPDSGRVLDCGGGPGRYALWLAKRGYDVTLFDLSPKCLEWAQREAERASLRLETAEGTATDLSRFSDGSSMRRCCWDPSITCTSRTSASAQSGRFFAWFGRED